LLVDCFRGRTSMKTPRLNVWTVRKRYFSRLKQ
jgi:hypothetical protein